MGRNVLVDRLKGYTCFLVLFGHVIMGMRNAGIEMPGFFYDLEVFIWSFHVSLFLFLSGIVYRITDEWKSKKTKRNFIKNKLINLGIPYIIFSVVYIVINCLVPQANTQFSVWDILFIWKTPIAQYWFLYALFFLFCIWTFFSGTLKNWQITVCVVLTGFLAPLFGVQFGSFEVVIYSALAFGLGTCVNISDIVKLPVIGKLLVIFSHIIAGIVLVKFNWIGYPVIKEIMMIMGISSSIMFISLIHEYKFIARFLSFMNKYSFQTYLLHTIFTAGIRVVLMKFNITQWSMHMLLGCIAGIAFSVLTSIIARKIRILNACFFPTKAYNCDKFFKII